MENLDFLQFNTSCRKTIHSYSEDILTYSLLSCVTLLTVVLNLLVIISISHFRKLYTTTNLLLLSLAVSDFLVGLLLMPFELFMRSCWIIGNFMCAVTYFVGFLFVNASVGTMVLISVDRYIAICDPMFYSTKVTLKRVQLCVCLCWIFSSVHGSLMMKDFLKQPDRYDPCYGQCCIVINENEGTVDLIVTFIGPITVIIVLYMRVFVVAVSQARAMRFHSAAVTFQRPETVTAKKSELKAARTLGVVIAVFLMCFCPFYCVSLSGRKILVSSSNEDFTVFVMYFNSCLNPLIYAFFYPWFRKSIKFIVTLEILQPDLREANIL
ncbi:trace amine-associated receptor 13c-like [Toxotes jaculatrix]|uniref:trace amine-associated receptor 13c-like n=1 Tax=Toxotes jaculatrix TaxID=941984 RepID=UPI001B3B03A5|nr:trace amine-associated receptor 13c-like [Toxotes jaculatrix]